MINVPDHYVRLQEMWCEDYSHAVTPEPLNGGDELTEWRNGYKKRKAQKTRIKKELLRVG